MFETYVAPSVIEADEIHKAAVVLGRSGGLKGGPARRVALTDEQRKISAQNAARARWGDRKAEAPPPPPPVVIDRAFNIHPRDIGSPDFDTEVIREPGIVDHSCYKDTPTDAHPGSEEKIKVMEARYDAGLPLFHSGDETQHIVKIYVGDCPEDGVKFEKVLPEYDDED